MSVPVETVLRSGEHRVHLFQVVREHRDGGEPRDWIVVDVDEESIGLATLGFEWTRSISPAAFKTGTYEPLVAGGVPVWGY